MIHNDVKKILISASKKVRAERIALELSQEEFANFVDIKYATYKTFEQKGKITFENYVKILIKINKEDQFNKFLDGFEFNEQKERANKKSDNTNVYLNPIIEVNQKHIILDKKVFGEELFYSVEDGHRYEIQNFINIVLNKWDDKKLMLLFKYFGADRLKPYILEQRDIQLLKAFNQHVKHIAKQFNELSTISTIKFNTTVESRRNT